MQEMYEMLLGLQLLIYAQFLFAFNLCIPTRLQPVGLNVDLGLSMPIIHDWLINIYI